MRNWLSFDSNDIHIISIFQSINIHKRREEWVRPSGAIYIIRGLEKIVRQKCIHYWFYCDEYDRYRLVICRKDQQSWKSIASTFSINLGVKITASIRALRIALFDRSWYHFHRVNQVLMPKHVTCPKTLENTLLGI